MHSLNSCHAAGETRLSLIAAREAQLVEDIKEITALHAGARKLLTRLDESGPGILDFLPGALRALLRARIVGPTTPAGSVRTGTNLDAERAALLHVLVMLEVLDWAADALHDARPPPATTMAKRRIVHGEFLRIAASAEDLQEMLEEELEVVRAHRAQLLEEVEGFGGMSTAGILSPPLELDTPRGAYGHSMLDRRVPPLSRPQSIAIPGFAWTNSGANLPSLMGISRQRSHSYPLSLGLLARSVIKGTITPANRRQRANSLDSTQSGDALRTNGNSN